MPSYLFRPALTAAVLTGAAMAHYTWISPQSQPLVAGKPVTVEIGHGHRFPASEEAIQARQVELFALLPSGARMPMTAEAAKGVVRSSLAVSESGVYRIALVQDRGVSSRTPNGVKPGGRDRNPNALRASRTLRTAVAYASTGAETAVPGKPLGLELEIVGSLAGGVWTLELRKQGKPAAGVAIEALTPGAGKPQLAGKTGADGRLQWKGKGPVLFAADFQDAAPAGAVYDSVNYETSLAVGW